MADRIAVMRAGRIEQTGTAADVYDRPANGFVAGFFSAVNRLAGRVRGGLVATPFGPVPAPAKLAEGAAVEVVIRPEALRLSLGGGPVGARVTAARLLGRSSLVDLRLEADGPEGPGFRARMPGRFLPPVGSPVEILLDPIQTFVFPAESTTSQG